MNPRDIIRAWKDPHYRAGLSATALAQLPAHPAGAVELAEATLHAAPAVPGFRLRSGLRAGAPTAICTMVGEECSAYGANLWQDDLPL